MVGLVDDEVVVGRDGAAASGEVGEEQGVVDDQQMRPLGLVLGAAEETDAVGRLAFASVSGEAVPPLHLAACDADLRAIAGGGVLKPEEGFREQAGLFGR